MASSPLHSPVILIIGAGIGGLSAAIRLARRGYQVRILEARAQAGGLAAGLSVGGFTFDAGPYILLDKPGLDWALQALDIDPAELSLTPIEAVYQVLAEDGRTVAFDRSRADTAARFEADYPGSGARYEAFVARTFRAHQTLKPLTYTSQPGLLDVLRHRAWPHVPFLLRSLDAVLRQTGLPAPIRQGISIWTHIAGQPAREAPSPMAFVPGLLHEVGSYYPQGGMRAVAELLEATARAAGVVISYDTKVRAIRTRNRAVTGVETEAGELLPASVVLSDSNGIGTYAELVDEVPAAARRKLRQLPLQSPGMCAYLAVRGRQAPYYLRFKLRGLGCTAFVQPGLLDPGLGQDGWFPARLIAPLDHATAAALGAEGQGQRLDELLAEPWWQEGLEDYRVLHRRSTFEWGREYHLYRDSMNPVMTARFMLQGRVAHRSPHVRGLYLTGSSTHPGQWVSFCAIAGVLAADCLMQDWSHA